MFKLEIKKSVAKYLLPLLIAPVLLLIIAFYLEKKAPINILPNSINGADSLFQISTYSDGDGDEQGSKILSSASFLDSTISFSYELSDYFEDRYAGITLNFFNPNNSANPFLDISDYSHITLDISYPNGNKQDVYLKALIEGYTKPKENYTHGFLRKTVGNGDNNFKGSIAIDMFKTPSWWIETRKLPAGCISYPNLSKVLQINIQNSSFTPLFTPITVTINGIKLEKHILPAMIPYLIICAIYIMLLLLIKFAKLDIEDANDDDSEKIIISYDKVEIEDEHSNDLERITDFISHNFADPELTVDMLSKGAGVSTSKIPTLLKMKFSMNFKQYLNTVRITEAKRLLIDTEHQIVTIAHSVGYNNIPHFNRTFKQVAAVSPKVYRQDPDSAKNHLPGSKID
jgi:AraC-like DNA-binding protein